MYFENLFWEQDLNWKEIYLLPWNVSLDCYDCYVNFSFLESHLLCYICFAKMLMKQYSIFSMNAILPRHCGKVQFPFLINLQICHSFHHRLPFLGPLIPTVMYITEKLHFIAFQNLYVQFKKTWKNLTK